MSRVDEKIIEKLLRANRHDLASKFAQNIKAVNDDDREWTFDDIPKGVRVIRGHSPDDDLGYGSVIYVGGDTGKLPKKDDYISFSSKNKWLSTHEYEIEFHDTFLDAIECFFSDRAAFDKLKKINKQEVEQLAMELVRQRKKFDDVDGAVQGLLKAWEKKQKK